MAIVGMEGFDYYETTNGPGLELIKKENYSLEEPLEKSARLKSGGRFGTGKHLRLKQKDNLYINVANSTITDTIYISFAIRFRNSLQGTGFLYVYNEDGDGNHAFLRLNGQGNIRAKTGAEGQLEVSNKSVNADTWYWMEVKVYSNNSGTIDVKVDGEDWITASGDTKVNAQNIGSFGLSAGNTDIDFDDLVWQDGSGTWLTDSRIETLLPNGTSDAGWSNTGGGTDWADVSVITDDTDSVYDNWIFTAVTDTETFDYDSISSDSIVRALSVDWVAKRDDVQGRTVKSTVTSGSQSGTERNLYTDWIWYQDIYSTSDGGSTAWNQTSIGSSGFGVEDTTT